MADLRARSCIQKYKCTEEQWSTSRKHTSDQKNQEASKIHRHFIMRAYRTKKKSREATEKFTCSHLVLVLSREAKKKKFSLLLTVLQSRKTVSTAHEKARSLYRSKLTRTWWWLAFSYAAKHQCWEKAERVPGGGCPCLPIGSEGARRPVYCRQIHRVGWRGVIQTKTASQFIEH
jgi:hypothetical protein